MPDPATQKPMPDQTPAPDAAGPHKRFGILLLKGYAGVYAVLIVLYFVHAFTGARTVAVTELEEGMRAWSTIAFETPEGAWVKVEPGKGLTDRAAAQARAAFGPGGKPPFDVEVYKEGALHAIPFPYVFGIWNFLGLALLLYTAVGDMLPKMLDAERERVEEELRVARAAIAEAKDLQRQSEQTLAELEAERKRLRAQAEEEARLEHERTLRRTEGDIERLRAAHERHLETETQRVIEDLRERVAAEAVRLAREEIGDGVADEEHERLVERFVRNLREGTMA